MKDDFASACRAAREDAAWLRVIAPGIVSVRGKDRSGFLHGLLSADVRSLDGGRGAPACLLTAQGKVVSPLSVFALADEHVLIGPAQSVPAAAATLSRMSPLADCEVVDLSGTRAAWLLLGPRRARVLEALVGRPCDPGPDAARELATAAGTVLAAADFFAGPEATLLLAPGGGEERLAGGLAAAAGTAGARALPPAALESLRIEHGAAAWGREAGPDCFPQELGWERAVHPDKGCYLGQEMMARLRDRGHVNRRLAGLRLSGEAAPGDAVEGADGAVLGRLSSVAPSPRLEAPLALALLKTGGAVPFTVRAGAAAVEAVLQELPL